MKAHLLCLLVFGVLALPGKSQRDFRVYTEPDNFKKFAIRMMAEKTKPGSITCVISFKQLIGYRCSEGSDNFTVTVNGSSTQQIATLTPMENAGSFSLNYQYQTYLGKNISKPDTLYPYLLPINQGKSIKTMATTYIGNLFGKSNSEFYSMGFLYQPNDTICATRAGLVINLFENNDPKKEGEIFNSHSGNALTIEQNDGTIARYMIKGGVKFLAQIGDKIIPGQPLAVFNQEDNLDAMLFDVGYLNLKSTSEAGTHFFTAKPRFQLSADRIDLALPFTNYASVIHPADIILKELSKREIKKLGLKN